MRRGAVENAAPGKQSLHDAESICEMMKAQVYGDQLVIEGEFSDLPIRLAQRGLQRVRLALVHGLSGANRRDRGELRARTGYGRFNPSNPPALHSGRDEFDRARG